MKRSPSAMLHRLVSGLLGLAYLECIRTLARAPFQLGGTLTRWLFVQAVLEGALWIGPVRTDHGAKRFSWRFLGLFVFWASAMVAYVLTVHAAAAWAVGATLWALLLAASNGFREHHWMIRVIGWGLLAGIGGTFLVVVGQIESRFAEEEFFVALQAVALIVLVGLLLVVHSWVVRRLEKETRRMWRLPGLAVQNRMVIVLCVVIAIVGIGVAIWIYQGSFYSYDVPSYPGISRDKPFLCGQGTSDPAMPGGEETFLRLLSRIEASPLRAAPEYGMLALGTGERRWAEEYRRAILDDAQSAKFTEPANSVKFGQYLAARRLYYLTRVQEAFPNLFTYQDMQTVRTWLAAVNRRALTVEWVDWLYALAFFYWPEGPYENQENGAGLLALLEVYDLANDDLSGDNRDYLERNRGGWSERFRNTDDAFIYQPEWIDNALFQSEYWGRERDTSSGVERNRALAFEWLLLQALPDGAPLGYNHPDRVSVAPTAYLGAVKLKDPRYVWWSARMLDWAEQAGVSLYAQPGVEQATLIDGFSPEVGSCLMFGDSGLPTQFGPLAPDKVVFRDGWTPDSRYLLLNLRFSGWHRYKATNTVTLFHQNGPLVVEHDADQASEWLPAGRSLFRDKRVPRENLNGLLISRTGMSAVLYRLMGLGSPWAQDPPHYATILDFETGSEVDSSRTLVENWRGWRHEREVYFYHDGPVIVIDRAYGPRVSKAALTWHFSAAEAVDDSRVLVRSEPRPVEVVVIPTGEQGTTSLQSVKGSGRASTRLLYRSGVGGELQVITAFLTGDWVGSQLEAEASAYGEIRLHVASPVREMEVLSPAHPGRD